MKKIQLDFNKYLITHPAGGLGDEIDQFLSQHSIQCNQYFWYYDTFYDCHIIEFKNEEHYSLCLSQFGDLCCQP